MKGTKESIDNFLNKNKSIRNEMKEKGLELKLNGK